MCSPGIGQVLEHFAFPFQFDPSSTSEGGRIGGKLCSFSSDVDNASMVSKTVKTSDSQPCATSSGT